MSVKDKVVLGKHSSHCSTEWVTGFAHTHQNPIWLLPRQPASPSTACNYSLGQSTSFPWSPDRAFGRPAVVTKCKFNVHKARVQPWPTYTCWLLPVAVSRRQLPFSSRCQAKPRSRQRFFFNVSTCQWLSSDATLQELFPQITPSTNLIFSVTIRLSCCHLRWKKST